MGFFDKLKEGLAKTKNAFVERINDLFRAFVEVDEDMMDELEEILITADIGVEAAEAILDELRDRIAVNYITDPRVAREELFAILRGMIGEGEPIAEEKGKMTVILVIGVNGVGKTTSIAKIANVMKKKRKKVLLAAADTFRAAAIDHQARYSIQARYQRLYEEHKNHISHQSSCFEYTFFCKYCKNVWVCRQ